MITTLLSVLLRITLIFRYQKSHFRGQKAHLLDHLLRKKDSSPDAQRTMTHPSSVLLVTVVLEEYTLRLKLLKKVSNLKMHDLLKVDSCMRGIRLENTLMTSLPPVNEIDTRLHEKLISVMEQLDSE